MASSVIAYVGGLLRTVFFNSKGAAVKTARQFLSEKYPDYEKERGLTGHDDIHMEKMMEEYSKNLIENENIKRKNRP